MSERESDLWTAVAIGAVVGIGATLLLRAQQEDDTHEILKRIKPVRRRAAKAAQQTAKYVRKGADRAGAAGEDLLSAGRELLDELQDGARDIVREARSELRKAARESVHEAQKAARRAARRTLR